MARKLKTYQTSLGFFDLAAAAPSMKAALEAWGADSNLFHRGAAKQSEDPDVIAATMVARRRSEASRRLQRALQRARRAAYQSRRRQHFEEEGRQQFGEA